MARFNRKQTECFQRRMLWKLISSVFIFLMFIVTLVSMIKLVKTHLWDSHLEIFPLNQLERGIVSRRHALQQVKDLMMHIKSHQQDGENFTFGSHSQEHYATEMSNSIYALGLNKLSSELNTLFIDKLQPVASDSSTTENSNDRYSRHFVTHRLCYDTSFTPQNNRRQVDPSFCPRLINLLNDIQQGIQPPLLTAFTWFPDPLVDVDKLRRRLLFENWNLLRPIVQPVLISDSRVNMAKANYFDWPCLPVSNYSPHGVPVFKGMARSVSLQFNSTFYGYVRPTTVFDASLIETLLKLKETYVDNQEGTHWNNHKNPQSHDSVKSILIYGRALRASHVGNLKDLEHISVGLNVTESHTWPDRKDSLVYLFYAGIDFSDIPDLISDDKYLTSLLVSRSMALNHLVVDASSTICCVHIFRDKMVSEWERAYITTEPRDPHFNKRLAGQYFHSMGLSKPVKWLNEVGTKFSRSGNIYIDVRSGSTSTASSAGSLQQLPLEVIGAALSFYLTKFKSVTVDVDGASKEDFAQRIPCQAFSTFTEQPIEVRHHHHHDASKHHPHNASKQHHYYYHPDASKQRMSLILNQEHNNNTSAHCFVIIKYGDNQEALLNSRCSTQIFVESIKRRCQCNNDSVLDLVDLQGQIRNLSISSEEYASDYVTGRETYIAIRVERQGENGPNKYIPLLNNLEKSHPELLVKLNNLSRPETRNNKRDRIKKPQSRQLRANANKTDSKVRPTSAERGSRSRQGK